MRILSIRFKNLNSLAGEWEIDLTHPEYSSNGIFAITGPTGSGKTTILDAICLALYGRTPRLDRVTKSGNEIMSRQCGECFAEVTFESQTGRHRCHWSQHRARRKWNGELQNPVHEFVDADTGEPVARGAREVAPAIVQATGMDFERFTRSMLLAQGGFAVFLLASPDDRAPILEQITGTKIYSDISIRVHELRRAQQEALALLQAETSGIRILDEEQERTIREALAAAVAEEASLAPRITETRDALAWLTLVDGLRSDVARLAEEATVLADAHADFQSLRERLARAVRAAALDGAYAALTTVRRQQAEDRAELGTATAALPALEADAAAMADALHAAEHHVARVKEEQQTAAPLIRTVRALDQTLATQQKELTETEKSRLQDAARIAADTAARASRLQQREDAKAGRARIDAWLAEHAHDAWLVSGLTGVEQQLDSLITKRREIVRKDAERDAAAAALEQAATALDACHASAALRRRDLDAASQSVLDARAAMDMLLGGRLLREFRAEKDALLRELALLTTIANLSVHRDALEDGRPCPVCGATEHPFARGNVPVPGDTELRIAALTALIDAAEAQEAAVARAEAALIEARQRLNDEEKREAAAAHAWQSDSRALAEATAGGEALRADFAVLTASVVERLQPLGITEIGASDVDALLASLRGRLAAWLEHSQGREAVEKRMVELDGDILRLDAVIATQAMALAGKDARIAALTRDHATSREERSSVYDDRDPDEEERRLARAVGDAEAAEKRARDTHATRQQRLTTAQAHVATLTTRIAQRDAELRVLEADLAAALPQAGFAGEEDFLLARMPADERERLAAKARELDEARTTLDARRQDREARLATELARQLTDRPLDELGPHLEELEHAVKELRDGIAGHRLRLRENDEAHERRKDRETAIAARERECRRWDDLHALIGSADGKKYRNFAQGLTFQMMIAHANRQLQKMTDRYLLVRNDTEPLELSVIDNYQAGEMRSTKNLSGGESFIVSLALALGLSQMASRNVRVDSLFLDEGFGTLDEEALDTALETLSNLHQDGKVIGIISHVSALKERIGARIKVTPLSGGRSRISGPGCRSNDG